MKNLMYNILLILLGVLVGLLLAEGWVRVFFPHPSYGAPQGLYRLNENRDYDLTPNFKGIFRSSEFYSHISTNSHGLRDREYESKNKDAFRIMVIGDSFAFGHGCELEDSFTKVLEANLNNAGNKKLKAVDVLNAGVGGYGIDHYYRHLKEKFDIYKPDLVVLSFFVGNDLGQRIGLRTVWDGYLIDKDSIPLNDQVKASIASLPSIFLKVKAYLAQHSHLFNFLVARVKNSERIKGFFNKTGLAAGEKTLEMKRLALQEKKREYILKKERNKIIPLYFQKYLKVPTLRFEEDWAFSIRYLHKIKVFLKDQDADLLVAFLPDRMQVHKEYWDKVLWQHNFDQNAFDLENINNRLSDFCATNSLSCVDMLPEFKKADQKGVRLYFKYDPHWNINGHRQAADILSHSIADLLKR